MTSSRVTRLGASILVSLLLTAGLTSSALGASPTDPVPSPSASAVGTGTSNPAGVPAKPNTQGAVPATTAPLYVISGTVTGTGGIPLGNIQVQASASSGPNFWAEETSVSNGLYRVLAPAGSYTLMFVDPTSAYLSGYYSIGGFTTVLGSATSITVGSSDVSGINLQLGKGHFIRGTVTTPVVGYSFTSLKVTAYGTGYTGDTTANPDGTYALDVPAGSYTVAFSDASGTYLNGYYSSGGFTTVPGSAGSSLARLRGRVERHYRTSRSTRGAPSPARRPGLTGPTRSKSPAAPSPSGSTTTPAPTTRATTAAVASP